MTAQPAELTHVPAATVRRIDPDSPAGRAASKGLGELFDDIAERLTREGKPVPECIRP